MNEKSKILVTGAAGAIGRRLVLELRAKHGSDLVVAGYNSTPLTGELAAGPSAKANVIDTDAMQSIIEEHNIGTIYHLAALLSIAAEKNPELAQKVNNEGFTNVLELAKKYGLKVFWPSSIAVFGPDAPKQNTPQDAALNPTTVYGKAKVVGELKGQEYFEKYGVDFRSVRLPGANDRLAEGERPGPGTTEYAMDMVASAKANALFKSPLAPNTALPMIDMRDVIRAIVGLMSAPKESIKIRTSYNLSAMSFTPAELGASILERNRSPNFSVIYENIDEMKQRIADSWPDSIDDSAARTDWGWKPMHDLTSMTEYLLSTPPAPVMKNQ